mgnify:CR=1 FL=1
MPINRNDAKTLRISVSLAINTQVNVTKTKDGRTRKTRDIEGNISNIGDINPGTQLKS